MSLPPVPTPSEGTLFQTSESHTEQPILPIKPESSVQSSFNWCKEYIIVCLLISNTALLLVIFGMLLARN